MKKTKQQPPRGEGRGAFLTTNGRISPFLVACVDELHYHRVPTGGAGNKVLRLLEADEAAEADTRRPPSVYIQDRGVSRWDTCAAQASKDRGSELSWGLLGLFISCSTSKNVAKKLPSGFSQGFSFSRQRPISGGGR